MKDKRFIHAVALVDINQKEGGDIFFHLFSLPNISTWAVVSVTCLRLAGCKDDGDNVALNQ